MAGHRRPPRVWLRIPHVVSRRFLAASFGLFYRLECFSNLRLELSTCDVSLAAYTCYRVRFGFGSADGETAVGPRSIKILLLFLFISRRFRSTVFLHFFLLDEGRVYRRNIQLESVGQPQDVYSLLLLISIA